MKIMNFEKPLDEKRPSSSPNCVMLEMILLPQNLMDVQRSTAKTSSKRQLFPNRQKPTVNMDFRSGNWPKQVEFVLSCIGYTIGLGIMWRFPYYCFNHGGGASLIPYLLLMVLIGAPLLLLEISICQYSGTSPYVAFKNICPAFQGLGVAMLIVSFLNILYYNVLNSWAIFYLFASFVKVLPWSKCEPQWSNSNCYTSNQDLLCRSMGEKTYWNSTCVGFTEFCNSNGYLSYNVTHCLDASTLQEIDFAHVAKRISASENYFKNVVLKSSGSDIDNIGGIQWQLSLCLILAWSLVFLCLLKGVYSSGKVMYFTAIFPLVLLVIIFVRCVILDGADEGIKFYVVPHFDKLGDVWIWCDAAVEVFNSLGLAFGALGTLASYNKFDNNCCRDTLIITSCVTISNVFAGFVAFSVIGHTAHELNLPIADVIHSGPEMAFTVYLGATSVFIFSSFWCFLYALMLLALGLDTQFVLVETVSTAFQAIWPTLKLYKTQLMTAICVLSCFIGLSMTTSGGILILNLIDFYATSWSIFLIAIMECVIVSWIYGLGRDGKRFDYVLEQMLGFRPASFWIYCWRYFIPLALGLLLGLQWASFVPYTYENYVYPLWANGVGWFISFISVSFIPVIAVYKIICYLYRNRSLRKLFRPTSEWRASIES